MASNTQLPRIKTAVLVVDLIEAIERVRDAEVKTVQAETATYVKKRLDYLRAVKKHLRAKSDAIAVRADFRFGVRTRWRDVEDWAVQDLPQAPAAPSDEKCVRQKYDGLIAQLRLSTEPKVRLSPEDFQKFMRGDASACAC
jgi:hypothetical protein